MDYKPQGVCSSAISFDVQNGCLRTVRFEDGCPGNLQAIQALVEGMKVEDVIARLRGISCGDKGTSCADQLVKAIQQKIEKN